MPFADVIQNGWLQIIKYLRVGENLAASVPICLSEYRHAADRED